MDENSLIGRLRQRHVIRWSLAYIAGAWVALQAAELLSDIFGWPNSWLQILTVLLVFGFFIAVTLAWFHGEKGQQRFSVPELVIILAVVGLAVVTVVRSDFGTGGSNVPDNLFAGKASKRATADPAYEAGPSWSPDSRNFVFASQRSGNSDLWIQQRDGDTTQLTDHPAEDAQPAWSPDGNTILFVSSRSHGAKLDRSVYYGYTINGDIWSVAAFGGEPQLLIEDAYNPDWSPDGETFAYDGPRDGAHRIWIASVDGSGERQVSIQDSELAVHIRPAVSPDGNWVAYERQVGSQAGTSSIRVVSLDGEHAFDVTGDDQRNMSPAWAGPSSLIFSSDRNGAMNLWQVNLDFDDKRTTNEPVQITLGAGEDHYPAVAPDGTLAWGSMRRLENLWTIDVDPETHEFGAEPERVLSASWNDIAPRISPDGRTLAFSSDRDGKYDIWLLEDGATEPRQLTSWDGTDLQASWSPDSSKVTFYSNERGRNDIWVQSVDGGPAVVITPEESDDQNSYWSPDGRRIVFTSDRGGTSEIWIMDAGGGEAKQLTDIGVLGHTAIFSPDGEWLLFTSTSSGNRDIWTVRSDGSGLRQITFSPTQDAHPLWSHDGKFVYYLSDHRTVHVTPFEEDQHKPVFDLGEHIDHTNLSSDGTRFFFTREKIESDIWLIE